MQRKILVLCLAVFILLGMLAGCAQPTTGPNDTQGSGTEGTGTQGSSIDNQGGAVEETPQEPLVVTWYINYDWCQDSGMGDPEERPLVKYLNEEMNVFIDWVSSNGAAAERLNTMIASDELPDIITIDRGSDVERLINAGKLVALDDYMNKYPNIKQNVGEQILGMLTSADGKRYQIPNWYIQPGGANGNTGWVINQKIYGELGSPKLETYTDLENYLREVRSKYPDIVPLETGVDNCAPHLIYAGMGERRSAGWSNNEFWYPIGNELKPITQDPAWQEAMIFTSRLFRDRLMSQDALTQSREQVEEKMSNGKAAVITGWSMENTGNQLKEWQAVDPDAGYFATMPLYKDGLDSSNVYVHTFNALGWNVNTISTKAKDPERIFALLDWVASDEGQYTHLWGPPGLYWDGLTADGMPNFTEKWFSDSPDDRSIATWSGINWIGNTVLVDGIKAEIGLTLPEEEQNWGTVAQYNVFWRTTFDGTEFANLEPPADSDEGAISTRVRDLYKNYLGQILFAKSDTEVEALIQSLEDDLSKAGFDKLLAFKTQKWQENKSKMGLN